jgi:hypothetical protein
MSFTGAVTDGLTFYGEFRAVVGAVIGVIVMIITFIIGVVILHNKHTKTAMMTVTQVGPALPQPGPPPGLSTGMSRPLPPGVQMYNVVVSFDLDGKTYSSAAPVVFESSAPPAVGSQVAMLYNPSNPTDMVQHVISHKLGWLLIGGGLLFGMGSVGFAILTFRWKRLAEFEGAAGILRAV